MFISLALLLHAIGATDAFKANHHVTDPLDKPFSQQFNDQYSPLKFLGGLGPYTSRRGNGISTEVPSDCEVDQVVLVQRHGERYPSPSSVKAQRKVLAKIHKEHPGEFSGDLEFLNHWQYFLENDGNAGLEIAEGPYAGYVDAFAKGARFRGRYGHLWDGESKVPIFAAESQRVVNTARKFGQGFFGYNYTDIVEMQILAEDPKVGLNAVSPYFCDQELVTECNVPNPDGYDGTLEVVLPQIDKAAVRLNEQYGLSLTAREVYQLFQVAAFDVSRHGTSKWLDVFTADEWTAFNYQQGLWLHCYFGAGSGSGRAIGAAWANATTVLLNQGPDDSGLPLSLSFGHDSEITNVLGGVGIISPQNLDPNQVTFNTGWDISDITPMGAQLVIERLKCKAPGLTNSTNLINSNSSLPETFLNQTYGSPSGDDEFIGYFDPNYTNGTITSSVYYANGSLVQAVNETVTGPFSSSVISVRNGTENGSIIVTNTTSVYGFNLTQGATNTNEEEESIFVRVLLNDAVVPLEFGYEGPGYSCSLEKWNEHIAAKVEENNYERYCKPTENNVPSYIDYFWNYNHTNTADEPAFIQWQGYPVM